MSSKKQSSKFLKGLTSFRVPPGIDSLAVEEYMSALDCPRALTVVILWRNSEHEQIAQLEFNPLHYSDMVHCRDSYAATKFLSKFEGLSLSSDLDKVAFEKFDKFELLCKSTNRRFRFLELDPLFKGSTVWLHNAVIHKISKILGDFESDEFFSMPDWGPGASTLIKRRDASPAKKFQCETGITRDLHDLIPDALLEGNYPLWFRQLKLSGFPGYQLGNKVITVPKDASTNRVIAIEPGINLWFQKSIGNMIRRRLLRSGVDLRWQTSNQQLARLGSISNRIATVDLSSASDSISCAVVEELLPPRWYHLMDACRSHYGSRNDSNFKWEKFSSMGNAFTFELESLIFYAVACCCAERQHLGSSEVNAYGDDVILPSACYEEFSRMMTFYGFVVNGKKSHYDSPFRESCGGHYYRGVDIKPVYMKSRLSSIPSLFRLANAVRRLARRRNNYFGCDVKFRRLFERLVQLVPRPLRLRIPEGLGDGGFIGSFDESTPSRARHGIEGYRTSSLVEVSKTYLDETEGYLLYSLWRLPETVSPFEDTSIQFVVPTLVFPLPGSPERRARLKAIATLTSGELLDGRNAVPLSGRLKFRLANSLVRQWCDLGPWI